MQKNTFVVLVSNIAEMPGMHAVEAHHILLESKSVAEIWLFIIDENFLVVEARL